MRNNASLILVALAVCGCDAQKVSVDQICKDEQVRGSVVVDGYLRAASPSPPVDFGPLAAKHCRAGDTLRRIPFNHVGFPYG